MTIPDDNWIVEWTYSPADYCEEPLEISCQDYYLTIKDGKVEVTTSRDPRPDLCEQLDAELKYRFQGIQLVAHKPYELLAPSVSCHRSNGNRTLYIEGSSKITVSDHADLTITDKNGNVVADTRAERIEKGSTP